MAKICSNPDCSNIKRVEGEVCPDCGSPAKDMGFREGTAIIKLKNENTKRKVDEAKEISVTEMDDEVDESLYDEIETEEGQPAPQVVNTAKWTNNTLFKIIVFIVVVIVFYMVFRLMM